MKPSLDLDETKGRTIKVQDGPLLMTPRGTMSRPLVFGDVEANTSSSPAMKPEIKPPTLTYETDRVNNHDIQDFRSSLAMNVHHISSSTSSSTSSTTSFRELYGGAITITLPDPYKDVSDLRPVPDHQEVYMDQNSSASFIMEILNYEDSITHDMAASYYFDDLAQTNQAIRSTILSSAVIADKDFIPSLSSYPSFMKCCLIGQQTVPVHRDGIMQHDDIVVLLVLIRLESVGTDLLITINTLSHDDVPKLSSLRACDFKWPAALTSDEANDVSSDIQHMTMDEHTGTSSSSPKPSLKRMNSSSDAPLHDVPRCMIAMRWALQSLRIIDWSLFA